MNPLPQRKKSVEEIAKLRETLGIPGQELEGNPLPVEARPSLTAEKSQIVVEPMHPVREPKEVRSLKRSERIPVLHPDGQEAVEKLPSAPGAIELPVAVEPAVHGQKVVRSLRKSEQGLVQVPTVKVVPDSNLPAHRHSDEEISRIRRMEAIEAMAPHERPRSLSAHLALVISGYLLAVIGAAGVYFHDLPFVVTAVLAGAALMIAIYIFIRKPLSRHHAAFIFIAVLFLTVFGALYYFPQIQHGT